MESSKERSCCFTGHRVISPEALPTLMDKVDYYLIPLIKLGITNFYVGGALGFDTLAAQHILELKQDAYPQIKLISVIPFPEWSNRWNEDDRLEAEKVLAASDKVIYTRPHYTRDAYSVRNRYMVDHSGYVIAYCDRNDGGTAYTLKYAKSKSRKIFNTGNLALQILI